MFFNSKNKNYIPEFKNITKGIRCGRNVYEGYQRGWVLQFGNLKKSILADPLYQEAYNVAHDRTIMSEEKRMNIFLLLRFFLMHIPFGHIIEFGAYRGGGAIFMAYIAKKLYPGVKIYALDSFSGMPPTDKNVDAHNEGDFVSTDLESLQDRVNELNLDNLFLVKGFFQDTTTKIMAEAGRIALAHIDCDIATSVKYSYESVKLFMVDGGYIVFDDATVSSCIGATEIVEHFLIRRYQLNSEQIWPHYVFRSFINKTKDQ